jgi:predicted MFS family arabinose efflux permease
MPDRRWIILAMLFAARAATGFQFQSVGSVSNRLIQDLGLSYAQIGLLLGAYLLPGIVVAFPAGLLGQRVAAKSLGLAGLALMTLSGLVLGHADHFAVALAARILGGVGATIVVLVATKMVTDWFGSREIVLAMSIVQMSWPFGAMLALPIQAVIAESFGWPAVVASGGICAAAAAVAFAFTSDSPRGAQIASTPSSGLAPALLLQLLVAGLAWGAMNLACILFFSYAPHLMTARGYSPTTAASLTSLAIWFTILAIPSGGYLVHRLGRPILAIVVCASIAAAMLLSFVSDTDPTLSCLIFGAAVGPLSGAILSLPARILPPQQRSLGFGVFYTCFYVLMAVGPWLAGRLQDAWATPAAALVAAALLLAVTVPLSVVFAVIARQPRPAARHDAGQPSRERAVQGTAAA